MSATESRRPVLRAAPTAVTTGNYVVVLRRNTTTETLHHLLSKASKHSDDTKVHRYVRTVAKAFTLKLSPYSLEVLLTLSQSYQEACTLEPVAPLRLVGGSTPSSGRVEVQHNGVWGTVCNDSWDINDATTQSLLYVWWEAPPLAVVVWKCSTMECGVQCDDYWDINDATVVCRQLGYNGTIRASTNAEFGEGNGTIWMNNVTCTGSESSWTNVPSMDGASRTVCMPKMQEWYVESQLLLYVWWEASTPSSGRWKCSIMECGVVCRQLGYNGTARPLINAVFGQGTGPIWMNNVTCTGSESSLDRCPFNGWGVNNCWHGEDAGVVPGKDLPLLLLFLEHLSLTKIKISCYKKRQMSLFAILCGRFEPYGVSDLETSVPRMYLGQPVVLLRLVGGSTPNSGRVEVQYSGVWGTVCGNYWDINDATVVCRQLGYNGTARASTNGEFGQGNGTIWMNNVTCTGSESSLDQCSFNGWGIHDCVHAKDAGVVCRDYIDSSVMKFLGKQAAMTPYAMLYLVYLEGGISVYPLAFPSKVVLVKFYRRLNLHLHSIVRAMVQVFNVPHMLHEMQKVKMRTYLKCSIASNLASFRQHTLVAASLSSTYFEPGSLLLLKQLQAISVSPADYQCLLHPQLLQNNPSVVLGYLGYKGLGLSYFTGLGTVESMNLDAERLSAIVTSDDYTIGGSLESSVACPFQQLVQWLSTASEVPFATCRDSSTAGTVVATFSVSCL
eukprot:Em0005g1580a